MFVIFQTLHLVLHCDLFGFINIKIVWVRAGQEQVTVCNRMPGHLLWYGWWYSLCICAGQLNGCETNYAIHRSCQRDDYKNIWNSCCHIRTVKIALSQATVYSIIKFSVLTLQGRLRINHSQSNYQKSSSPFETQMEPEGSICRGHRNSQVSNGEVWIHF